MAATADEARQALDAYLAGEASPDLRTGHAGVAGSAPVVMVFPGQGSQWLGMGRGLLRREQAFAEAIDRLDAAYRAHVDWSLRAVLEGLPARKGGLDVDWTTRLDVLQPVLVAVEVALASLWRRFGVEPQRVLGQSMGELAAAHVAGALGLEDLARIACERGRMVARAAGRGAMAVVSLGRDEVARRLADGTPGVEIAGSNSPTTTILSGDAPAVAAAVEAFEAEGVFARRLEVDFASHCFHMDPVVEPFRAAIGEVEARSAAIPFDSTVDGETKRGEELGTDYWLRNLREAVAFDRGLAASLAGGGEIFLEVSPHPALPRAIDETAQALGHAPRYVSSLRRGEDESRCLLLSLAELFVRGHAIAWSALQPEGQVVDLPLYAYQRKRYFFSARTRLDTFRPVHPLLGVRSDSSVDPRLHSWDFPLDADSGSFLQDVRAPSGASGAPGANGRRAPESLAIELALAAGEALWPGRGISIEELALVRPLELPAEGRRTVQVVVREEGPDAAELRVASRARSGEDWLLHATARLVGAASRVAIEPLVREGNASRSIDDYYAALERCGVGTSSPGRVLRELEVEPGGVASEPAAGSCLERDGDGTPGVVGKLMLPRSIESEWYAYHAHPLLLDAALQLTGALFDAPAAVRIRSIESIELAAGVGSDCVCRVRRRGARGIGSPGSPGVDAAVAASSADACSSADAFDRASLVADLDLFDRKGVWVGSIRGVCAEALPARTGRDGAAASEWHRIEWRLADEALLSTSREVERFILVSDSEAHAAWLAAELEKQGVEIRFCEKVEDLEPLVRLHRATADGRYGFLLLAWADRADEGTPEPEFQREYRVGEWAEAIRAHTVDAAQIWIATRGLQPRGDSGATETRDDAAGTGDLGEAGPDAARPSASLPDARLRRHVAREIDTFASCAEMQQCRLFDARRALDELDLAWLAALVGRPGEERQFVMGREGARVPRLVVVAEGSAAAGSAPRRAAGSRNFRALATGREGRAALALQVCPDPPLEAGELRVEVAAAALSGFDVATGLGLARVAPVSPADTAPLPQPPALGLDFAGIVTELGPGVRDVEVGDRVVGLRSGATTRRLVVGHRAVARIPERIDFVHAASLAWPSLVAAHVLGEVARVRPGERVLVVSAGGGVGQALVGRARALGASVFATASSPARRAALEAQGACVVEGDGAGEGDGVDRSSELPRYDVIVGSESGPALHGRLGALAEGGRYVDLCPRERFLREEVGALRLGRNRAYLAVDCLAALESDARGIGARLEEALADFEAGVLAAIPVTSFPVSEAARALRFMTQNRQTGRVVLDLARAAEVRLASPSGADAAELDALRFVVSGAGESSRATAVRRALVSRLRARAAAEVVELDAAAAGALASAADVWIHVSDESADSRDRLRHRMAGSGARDRILVSLREEVVGEPDRDRAWEARLWVDRLLLSGGQADAGRASDRAPGLSLGLSFGLPSGDDGAADRVARSVLRAWSCGLASDQVVVLPAAEQALRSERAPSPLMASLAAAHAETASRAFDRSGFLALSPPERRAALGRHVVEELAGVLGLAPDRRDRLDPGIRLDALGLDSLMTMELFMGLGRSLELPLAADWFPPGPTLAEIAQVLVRRLEASLAGGSA
ncbi:MAG: acyltransferase domain-containing protein [Deltaproteobacteria bacterium]|nr:acyltransferase domain-containing protein [Deltaproteobacteria bacterium]